MAAAMGVDPASNATVRCRLQDARYAEALYQIVLDPLGEQGIDYFWTDWGKGQ